jgi:hypothetical protein
MPIMTECGVGYQFTPLVSWVVVDVTPFDGGTRLIGKKCTPPCKGVNMTARTKAHMDEMDEIRESGSQAYTPTHPCGSSKLRPGNCSVHLVSQPDKWAI